MRKWLCKLINHKMPEYAIREIELADGRYALAVCPRCGEMVIRKAETRKWKSVDREAL